MNPVASKQTRSRLLPSLITALCAAKLLVPSVNAQDAAAKPANEEEAVVLSEFKVSSTKDIGYRATNTLGVSKTNTAIADLPMTVQVVTADFIRDFGGVSFDQTMRYVPGVTVDPTRGHPQLVRGLSTPYFFVDGMRRYTQPATATIERVEIVRGANGVVYGETGPGGTFNIIMKKPTGRNEGTADFQISQYGTMTETVDVSFGLGDKENGLAARVIFQQLDGPQRREEYVHTQTLVHPVISWTVSPKTSITYFFDYTKNHEANQLDNGLFGYSATLGAKTGYNPYMMKDPYVVNPYRAMGLFNNITHLQHNIALEQNLISNEGSIKRWDLQIIADDMKEQYADHRAFFNDYNGGWIQDSSGNPNIYYNPAASAGRGMNHDKSLTVDTALTTSFGGGIENKFSASVLYARRLYPEYSRAVSLDEFADKYFWGYNAITNTVYKRPGITESLPPGALEFNPTGRVQRTTEKSIFVFDQLSLINQTLHLFAGARIADIYVVRQNPADPDNSWKPTTPQFGASYKVNANVNVYASYSKSFFYNASLGAKQGYYYQFIPVQNGVNKELGIKYSTTDQKLSGTVSIFDLMQNGQGRTDTTLKLPSPYNIKNPTDQGVFDGTNTVKGVDADLYWSPSKEFSMFAYFSYLDAKQGTVSTGAKAANLTGVGKVNGSVWGKHTWYKVGSFDTFYAGGGMTYRSEVESSWSQGSATMPKIGAQTTLDLVFGVTKKFGKKNVLQFQVNGANVTDKLLMNPNSAVLGNGREFTFTTSLKF